MLKVEYIDVLYIFLLAFHLAFAEGGYDAIAHVPGIFAHFYGRALL
jgi:hypothetical protein